MRKKIFALIVILLTITTALAYIYNLPFQITTRERGMEMMGEDISIKERKIRELKQENKNKEEIEMLKSEIKSLEKEIKKYRITRDILEIVAPIFYCILLFFGIMGFHDILKNRKYSKEN